MENKGRKYINFDRQLETDANCLTFKPVPMLITDEMLNVPQGNHTLDGVKPSEKRLPARPKNLLALANSLANVGNLPVQVVLDKLEKEERQLVRNHLNNTWGFMGDADSSVSGSVRSPSEFSSGERMVGYQFLGSESDASSEYQMGEDEILAEREILTGRLRQHGGRRMGAGRPTKLVRQIAYSEGIPVREAREIAKAKSEGEPTFDLYFTNDIPEGIRKNRKTEL